MDIREFIENNRQNIADEKEEFNAEIVENNRMLKKNV